MGGLFSNTKSEGYAYKSPNQRTSYASTSTYQSTQSPVIHHNYINAPNQIYDQNLDSLIGGFQKLQIQAEKKQVQHREISQRNLQIFNLDQSFLIFSSTVTFIPLERRDPEYLQIVQMITRKQNFKVDNIEKIINPFLEKAYLLKKEQKLKTFPHLQEVLLFHGTLRENVHKICTYNFNWRLCKTHKFGQGVSFSPNSTYASVYSDEGLYGKVMLVAKVMIGRSDIGNKTMNLPPEGYDTTHKNDGVVIVKYEDNEFYPVYKITYHLIKETPRKTRGNSRKPKVHYAY